MVHRARSTGISSLYVLVHCCRPLCLEILQYKSSNNLSLGVFSFICWIAFTANGILKRDELFDFPKLGWPHFAMLVAHLIKDLVQQMRKWKVDLAHTSTSAGPIIFCWPINFCVSCMELCGGCRLGGVAPNIEVLVDSAYCSWTLFGLQLPINNQCDSAASVLLNGQNSL